jgi:manganese transport protein
MRRLLQVLFWSIVPAAFIGPGTVTTAASAGARHGHALLWALAFSTLATLVLMEAAARVTVVSGRNLGEAIRDRFGGGASGVLVLGLVLGAIVLGNAAFEAGNVLGAAAGAGLGTGLAGAAVPLAVGVAAAGVLWIGTPRTVATLLSVTVAFMGVAFLATALLLRPPAGEVLRGALVPSFAPGTGLLVLGLVGTTVVPYNLFLGSGIAAGQTLPEIRFGLSVAVLLGGVVSMGIVVVGAAAPGEFSYEGLAATLTGRLGPWGGPLFAWGLFAAGLSSAITAPLAAAVTARSLFGRGEARWGDRSARFRAVWGGVLLVGVGFGVAGVRPIPAIILAQALNGVVLPFAAVFLLLVVNDRVLMGERGLNGPVSNTLMALTVGTTLALGVSGVLRAGATAAGMADPGEGTILLAAAAIAAVLLVPVLGGVRRRRRGDAAAGPAAPAPVRP